MRLNKNMQEQQLRLALQQRMQGFRYTRLELVNWLCTEFDITIQLSERIVDDVLAVD
jgi:hypothetical protein